jgi:hypothetical protein
MWKQGHHVDSVLRHGRQGCPPLPVNDRWRINSFAGASRRPAGFWPGRETG